MNVPGVTSAMALNVVAAFVAFLTLIASAHAQAPPQQKPVTAQQMADYRAKLAVYQAIHGQFEADASLYWATIAERRKSRNAKRRNGEDIVATDYVLTQPPVYSGPPLPIDPSGATPPPVPRAP